MFRGFDEANRHCMKLVWRILFAAVIGGLVCGFLGTWGVLWVAGLIYGAKLEQGALIVLRTGPIGALIGILLGAVIAAISSRRK